MRVDEDQRARNVRLGHMETRKRTADRNTTRALASIAHGIAETRFEAGASSKFEMGFELLVCKIVERLANPRIATMMSIPINNSGVVVMRFRLPKELIVTAFRRAGIVIKKLESSPEGQFKSLLKTYQIDTVLDVGANVGQYATMLRREAKFQGDILSFEPMEQEFVKLQHASRHDPRWRVFNYALGDTNSQMAINVSRNSVSSSLLPANTRLFEAAPQAAYSSAQTVQVRTLDSVFDELDLNQRCIYLKIDAQGYESKILTGGKISLSKVAAVQLEMPLFSSYAGSASFDELYHYLLVKNFHLTHLIPGFFDKATGELYEVDGVFHRNI